MCGIVGIFSYHPTSPAVDRDELVRIRDHMAARSPDGTSDWYSRDGRIGLGHRRLAIIDCSATVAQPMASADGKLINGEIYNYRARPVAGWRPRGESFACNRTPKCFCIFTLWKVP